MGYLPDRKQTMGLVAAILLLAACGSDPYSGQSSTVAPTFSAIQANILIPQCAVCHSTQNAAGGFSVSSYQEVMATGGAVTPFQAYVSELYTQTLSGTMPKRDRDKAPDATPLSSNQLQAIYNWISYGALNN
jgi:hypothetical protein